MYKYNCYQNTYKASKNEKGTLFNFWYKSQFVGENLMLDSPLLSLLLLDSGLKVSF